MADSPGQRKSRKSRRSGAINHHEAFADYVRMPRSERSYTNLAETYVARKYYDTVGTARSVIARWAREHRWQERIDSAATEQAERDLREAAELDAQTFRRTSQELNRRSEYVDALHMDELVRMRESVRKPMPKGGTSVNVNVSLEVQQMVERIAEEDGLTDDEKRELQAAVQRHLTSAP